MAIAITAAGLDQGLCHALNTWRISKESLFLKELYRSLSKEGVLGYY